ncbi:MAG: hypothetical protein ACYTFY_10245 [Planctomycetota bacterium]|jgi:hypothetical protein
MMSDKTQDVEVGRHKIDWQRFRVVVFESDDWGACEIAADKEMSESLKEIWQQYGVEGVNTDNTLESADDLERLYSFLERFTGSDNQPVVFTNFMCMANPDFKAVKENKYGEYLDIGIDEGLPSRWQRKGLIDAWRDGVSRGVVSPEFHANLHHTSPVSLMSLLNEKTSAGDMTRKLFAEEAYYSGVHLPEYDGMNVREQMAWVVAGVRRFENLFGYTPAAAVTSDAFPITETVWSLCGLRTVCLKNSRNNNGEVVVYHTKPWNNQDIYVPLGAYCKTNDVVYMTRNAFLEGQPPQQVLKAIKNTWTLNEPAIVSTHRKQYVSLNKDNTDKGYANLETLLTDLSAEDGIRYLSTAEVSDLYRQGWSARQAAKGVLVRKWSDSAEEIRLYGDDKQSACSLSDGKTYSSVSDKGDIIFDLPLGDYLIS